MRKISCFDAVLIVIGFCFSAVCLAETSRYEEPIRYRQAVMTLVKRHFDKVSAMAKGTSPFDRDELVKQVTYLEMLSKLSMDGFVPGSHEGNTRAKSEIWSDWAKFRSAGEKFQFEARKLKESAVKTTPEALKIAMSEMTRACKSCHDDFKATAN